MHVEVDDRIQFVSRLDERLTCPICNNAFNEPWQTSCGHRFCKKCLDGLLRSDILRCPVDGEEMQRDGYFRDKYCEREVLSLSCFCRYKDRGCDWKGELRNLKTHEASCQYGVVQCQACGESMEQRNLEEHRLTTCIYRVVMCTYCRGRVQERDMKDHLGVCPKLPVSCVNCGQEDVPRDMMNEHMITHCPSAEHLCPFSIQGCEFKGKSECLRHHLKNCIEYHQKLVTEYSQETNRKIKEMEETISRLERENSALEQRINSASFPRVCERRIDITEDQLALHEIQLSEQNLGKQMLEATSYNGVYLWKIDQYGRRFQEAVSGKTVSIYSPPFYVGRFGYKVCARLYLNGDGMGKGTHLSVFFVIMRGEYDALLPWPFSQKVHFRLIDQDRVKDVYDAFRPDPRSSSFKKPTSDMNIASGCPTFISQAELRQGGYVRNDTMFIKITIDTYGLQGEDWK